MRSLILLLPLLCLAPALAAPDGKALYATHCADCHGSGGKGDGESASYYTPKPSDLTVAKYQHGTDDASLARIIREGIPNTQMEGNPKLTPEEAQALVDYLKSLRK